MRIQSIAVMLRRLGRCRQGTLWHMEVNLDSLIGSLLSFGLKYVQGVCPGGVAGRFSLVGMCFRLVLRIQAASEVEICFRTSIDRSRGGTNQSVIWNWRSS